MNTKLGPFRRLLAVGGIALAGTVALTGCGLLESDADGTTEVSDDQVDAVAEAAAGDCLPFEVLSDDPAVFEVDCAGDDAFWSITNIVADPGVTAEGGSIADPQPVYDTCGEEIGAYVPGKAWTDWNMIYDVTTGNVDYLFCIEAIDKASADGKTPVTPDVGDCMSSSDTDWFRVDCGDATADTTVTDAIVFDTAEWAAPDVDSAAANCPASYYELSDQFGRTSGVLCVE